MYFFIQEYDRRLLTVPTATTGLDRHSFLKSRLIYVGREPLEDVFRKRGFAFRSRANLYNDGGCCLRHFGGNIV